MLCQTICPLNREYIYNIKEAVIFSETETSEILGNTPMTELSSDTAENLRKLGLFSDYNLLGRNLNTLMGSVL